MIETVTGVTIAVAVGALVWYAMSKRDGRPNSRALGLGLSFGAVSILLLIAMTSC